MLRDNNVRYHAIEMVDQLRYLDANDQLEHLDELIDMLQKRKEALRFTSMSNDRYEVKNIGGYYTVYKNGKRQKGSFVTEREAYDSLPDSED